MKDGLYLSQRAIETLLFVFIGLLNWGAFEINRGYIGWLPGIIAVICGALALKRIGEALLDRFWFSNSDFK